MNSVKTYETERLTIKPTSVEDAPFVLELLNTPKWIKYIGDRHVHTIEEAEEYIKSKILPQLQKLGFSNYTVSRKSDNVKIGTCGLYDRDGIEGVDIGFAFLPNFENKGYAFEAASKIKKVAIENFYLDTLSAITTKDNFSSQKLLSKLGFVFSKKVRIPNDDEELMLYILKSKT